LWYWLTGSPARPQTTFWSYVGFGAAYRSDAADEDEEEGLYTVAPGWQPTVPPPPARAIGGQMPDEV